MEEGPTCAGPSSLWVPAQIAKTNDPSGLETNRLGSYRLRPQEDLYPPTVPKCFGLGFSYGGDSPVRLEEASSVVPKAPA